MEVCFSQGLIKLASYVKTFGNEWFHFTIIIDLFKSLF